MATVRRRANGCPRSVSSVLSEPLLQETDNDVSPLAGRNDLYLTRTKDGKPAFGRKKPDKLLQGFGFDILGETFGIPSRRDYERQARSLSVTSQSSGPSIAPGTPRRPDNGRQMYKYDATESPLIHRKTSSIRSSSTPAPPAMARYNSRDAPSSDQHAEYKRSLSLPRTRSQTFNQHCIPPPPPPPPSVVGWHNHPVMNSGIAPTPMNYYSAAYQPPHSSSYPYNNPMVFQSAQNWANPQHPRTVQHPNPLGAIPPRTTPIPVLPYHQQFSQPQPAQVPYIQTIPTARLFNIPPPPPPPPPQNWSQAHAMVMGQGNIPQQDPNWAVNAGKTVGRADQATSTRKDAIKTHEEPVCGEDMKKNLGKRILHVHACAGCGKKRSSRYQRAHPLKRGEIPPLNYCYDCLRAAADADGEASDRDVAHHHPSKKDNAKATVLRLSADEGHENVSGKYTHERGRHGPRWFKKSTRFGSLSGLFSHRPAPKSSLSSPRSISSAEESRSRASLGSASDEADESDESDAANSVYKTPERPLRRSYERVDKKTFQQQPRTPAVSRNRNLNRNRYASINSRNEKYNSPLLPREVKSDKVENKGKMRALGDTKPFLSRSHILISRSQRQTRGIDNDLPLSSNADDSRGMSHEQRDLPDLGANDTERVISRSPSGMEALSNYKIPNKTHETMNQINTQGATNKRKTKSKEPSGIGGAIDVSNQVQRRGVQASASEHLVMPIAESADEVADHAGPSEPRVTRNYNPEIDSKQEAVPDPFPDSENGTRWSPHKRNAGPVDKPKAVFDWHGPFTPTDAPYASNPHSPRVVGDTWSDYQTDMEREAEEMAERDLAFAGKLFDSLSGSLGGSATSAFPISSHVTTSNLSIVSYNSDSGDCEGDGETTIPTTKGVGGKKHAKQILAKDAAKRIEFSSEKEQQEKSSRLKAPLKSSLVKLPGYQRDNIHGQQDVQDDDTDYFPLPIGSSLVGHTGHSQDGLLKNPPALGDVATTANDHCLRRLGRLPPT
ncbi:hypothetical protein GGR51DRAFT_569912 [Nemania sp. FL0031]|nr:hypothetical protein GGR51DRAFT_569912 [Nemania sp. FL0031]